MNVIGSIKQLPAGIVPALASAVLFGGSTAAAKVLLFDIDPVLMAGLLYLGSGVGLSLWVLVALGRGEQSKREAPLRRTDVPWLAGAILCGGVLGPLLLMTGLARTPGSTASLLLNLEGLLTALLAWFIFKENFDRRIAVGFMLILAGGAAISWGGTPEWKSLAGPVAIAAACLCWGVDNNLTRFVSGGDAVQIACLKGLAAGAVNLTIALAQGNSLPDAGVLCKIALVGFLGYGVSLVLFIRALRHLGSARTGAYFSVAPFVGAGLSILLLNEPLTAVFALSALLMGLGVWLHVTERHEHEHAHEYLKHNHMHTHDEHHQHDHPYPVEPGIWHAHEHEHFPLVHSHPHFPDLHHRHSHSHR